VVRGKSLLINPAGMWVMWVCYTVTYQVSSCVAGTLVLWKAVNCKEGASGQREEELDELQCFALF